MLFLCLPLLFIYNNTMLQIAIITTTATTTTTTIIIIIIIMMMIKTIELLVNSTANKTSVT